MPSVVFRVKESYFLPSMFSVLQYWPTFSGWHSANLPGTYAYTVILCPGLLLLAVCGFISGAYYGLCMFTQVERLLRQQHPDLVAACGYHPCQ